MSKKKTRQKKSASNSPRRKSQVVIAIAVALSVVVGATILAYSGAFSSTAKKKREKDPTVSPSSIDAGSPSKEYVYGGGKLIATEEPSAPSISISGRLAYCVSATSPGVPNANLLLSGNASSSTSTDSAGNYAFSNLAGGGTYVVTPSKTALAPGATGVNSVDVLLAQRAFLGIGAPLTACQFKAADVNEDAVINALDVLAIRRFFLNFTTGIGNTGQWRFTPPSRTFVAPVTNQSNQNHDSVLLGDVNGDLGLSAPGGTASYQVQSTATVQPSVSLPTASVGVNLTTFTLPCVVTDTTGLNLVGFQGDFTFDSSVVTIQSATGAGLTAGGWSVSGKTIGAGTIKTFRFIGTPNDGASPLSGAGTLFSLNMTRVGEQGQSTPLTFGSGFNDFEFIEGNAFALVPPGGESQGSITIGAAPAAQAKLSSVQWVRGSRNRSAPMRLLGNRGFGPGRQHLTALLDGIRSNLAFSATLGSVRPLSLGNEPDPLDEEVRIVDDKARANQSLNRRSLSLSVTRS